jgi:GNAT superfamily N-acetyltransferase
MGSKFKSKLLKTVHYFQQINRISNLAPTLMTAKKTSMRNRNYEMRYHLISPIDDLVPEPFAFISEYEIEVFQIFERLDKELKIGRITLNILHLSKAIDHGYRSFDLFDTEGYLLDIGEDIMNFDLDEVNEDIQEFYDDIFDGRDIGIIKNLELLPSHRGRGLAAYFLRDIDRKLSAACGLWIAHIFPAQFEDRDEELEPEKNWNAKLELSSLEKDYEKSIYKLMAFFKMLGFSHIEGYEEYMFYNTSKINEALQNLGQS